MAIPPIERLMFEKWSADAPVSRWEAERERRIADITAASNHFVKSAEPNKSGVCPWE